MHYSLFFPYKFVNNDRYIMADVSGANLNPAVSLGLALGKRISVERFVIYLIAQVLLIPTYVQQ